MANNYEGRKEKRKQFKSELRRKTYLGLHELSCHMLFECLLQGFEFFKEINLFSVVKKKNTLKVGSVSPTYLRTTFTPVAPKSIKIRSSCQYLFTLLGSTGAKAARRLLMKLTLEL